MAAIENKSMDPIVTRIEKLQVLLIENDPSYASLVREVLGVFQNPCYEVEEHERLDDALKIAAIRKFDIVILDLNLPDSHGLDTFRCIHNALPSIPSIVLTSDNDDDIAMEVMRHGAQDFLLKEDLNGRLLNRLILHAVERKRTENEMYLAQEKFRTIFENSAVAITVTDSQERIISWNKFAEKLLKMGPEDLYLKPVSSLYTEEEWRRIRSLKIRDKGIQHNLETSICRKDGVVVDAEISITVLKDVNGNITGSIGILKDISERKRAAREIRRAEEKYRTIFENSAVAIMVADSEEKIISWNKFSESFLGMSYEDLYLRSVDSLYPPEEWKKIRACDIREKDTQHILETRTFHKDGHLIDIDLSISALKDAHGKVTGSIGIMKDITARKKLLEMKDDFVNQVSHELRTPLSIVRESISQTLDGVLGSTTDSQQRILGMSLSGVDRLIRTINDLLEVSRMEAKKIRILKAYFEINPVVEELIFQFKPIVETKGLILISKSAEDSLKIFADKDRLIQIFTNLIDNALKFTDSGTIEIDIKDTPEGVKCAVRDTGRGISEADQQKLFSKFEQFGQSGQGAEKGSGLGLSICKGLVELHEGTLSVQSTLGEGTTFTFIIPHHS